MSYGFLLNHVFIEPKVKTYFLKRYGTDRLTLGLMDSLKSIHSTPRTPREIVFSFGGWTHHGPLTLTNLISVYDPTRQNWGDMETALGSNWAYMGAVLVESSVYFCGGYDNEEMTSNKLIRLDLQSMQFTSLSKMTIKRNYICLTNVNNSIYAIGGNYMNERLSTGERYDINKNQWYDIQPMSKRRSDAGIATVNSIIYVVGGFDGSKVHDSVEAYNTRTGKWKRILNMSTRRSGVKAVEMNEKLFVVGGWDGNQRLKSGECYDPVKRRWERLPDMRLPRSNFSLTVVDGQLFAAGGYDGEGVTSRSEFLNKFTNTWVETGEMPSPRSALAILSVPVEEIGKDNTSSLRELCTLNDAKTPETATTTSSGSELDSESDMEFE